MGKKKEGKYFFKKNWYLKRLTLFFGEILIFSGEKGKLRTSDRRLLGVPNEGVKNRSDMIFI